MSRWKMLIVGVVLILVADAVAIGSENEPFERFVTTLTSIAEPIRWARSMAWGFQNFYDVRDWRVWAQAIVNMLEGPDSPLFDALLDPGQATAEIHYDGKVVADMVMSLPWNDADVRGAVGGLGFTDAEWQQVERGISERLGFSSEGDIEASWVLLDDILRLASEALQRVAKADEDPEILRDDNLTGAAFLGTAKEMIRAWIELLQLDIRVGPGESIQAAIDGAIAGSTVWIAAGTYRESLEITKSIRLSGGWWSDYVDEEQTYDSNIEPVGSQAAIFVHSDDPIDVRIDGLDISDTALGISVFGEARLTLERVQISRATTAIRVADRAELVLDSCWLDDNGVALLAEGESVVDLDSNCRIEASTDPSAAIVIRDRADVTIDGTWIQRGAGSGILLAGSGFLTLTNGFISGNRGDGILLAEGASLDISGTFFYSNSGFAVRALSEACPSSEALPYGAFTGTITGTGNAMGEHGSALQNEENATCPTELETQLETLPDDENVGETE